MNSIATFSAPQSAIAIRRIDDHEGDERHLAVLQPERGSEGHREHPTEHEHVAVGEVDQLEDSVDERVPECDERIDAPDRQPDQHHLGPLGRCLDQVDEKPAEHHRDQ